MRLSAQFFLGRFVVLTVVLGLTGWVSVWQERLALQSILKKQGNTITQALAAFSTEALVAQDYPALEHALHTIGRSADNIDYIEVTQAGHSVARYGASAQGSEVFHADVLLPGEGAADRHLGRIRVEMSARDNLAIITARIGEVVVSTLIVFAALGLSLRVLLRRQVIRRVEELTSLTARVIAEELPQQALKDHGRQDDELEVLRGKFLIMLDGLKAHERERDRAMRKLVEARALLEDMGNSMPSALILVDRKGRVLQMNRMAADLLGQDPTQLQNRRLTQVFAAFADLFEEIVKVIASRHVFERHKIVVAFPDRQRLVNVTIYPLTSSQLGGAVVRIDDVTERARFEELMVQSEKMVSIGGLAAGVAHEINNPLGVILQATQNIERRVSEGLAPNHAAAEECGTTLPALRCYLEKRGILQFLADIRDDGLRAAQIVRNLLEFSRKSESVHEPVNVGVLLERAVDMARKDYNLKKKSDFRKVEVVLTLAPDLPSVPMIKGEMEQVLLNLLRNSAQAMADSINAPLAERASFEPRVELRARVLDDWLEIQVSDNGPGFSDEARRRAFEPFFTTKPVGTGTGLGLWVSYMIVVDKHKGHMRLESAPGQGATFILHLPLQGLPT